MARLTKPERTILIEFRTRERTSGGLAWDLQTSHGTSDAAREAT